MLILIRLPLCGRPSYEPLPDLSAPRHFRCLALSDCRYAAGPFLTAGLFPEQPGNIPFLQICRCATGPVQIVRSSPAAKEQSCHAAIVFPSRDRTKRSGKWQREALKILFRIRSAHWRYRSGSSSVTPFSASRSFSRLDSDGRLVAM